MTIFIIIVSNDSVLFKWGLSEGMCCGKVKLFSVVLLGKDCTRFQYLVYGLQVSKISGGLEKYFVSDGTPLSKVVRKLKHIPNH